MAAISVPNNNPGYGLRTEVAPETIARINQGYAARAREDYQIAMSVLTFVLALAAIAALYALRHRRKIARVADAALISGLATGVRAARTARSKRDGLIRRILAKADETPPSRD